VTGSDEAVYPPISEFLDQAGLAYKTPYHPDNIPKDADLIVIGKNAKLMPETNKEVAAAQSSGKPILSFPEVLAELSIQKKNIVIAGSYGKSTSTALLAHVLEQAGLNPSYFIGAVPLSTASAKMGAGELFVLEGDEYPASNTDPRSKFLLMRPHDVLLTPLAHDHFNIFPTTEAYMRPFYELLSLVPAEGTVVAALSGPLSRTFLAGVTRPVITYGVHEGDFCGADIVWGERTSFTILHQGKKLVSVTTSQLGEHNIENILGVAAMIFSRNLVSPEQFAQAIASFKGITRRLDRKTDKTSLPIFEGFGSSYDKLKSAIAAMKLHFPAKRLLVVFEPNTIGWRSRATLTQYDNAFKGAAKVYVFNPPHDGKETELSADDIARRIAASGIEAAAVSDSAQTLDMLTKDLQADDAILLSSSGAFGGLTKSIPALAERKFPA
jgi:UDP-N-acetylmuramate: L-alanyl-gamma-D-glutamyl-meso-diaminopimelate ligase